MYVKCPEKVKCPKRGNISKTHFWTVLCFDLFQLGKTGRLYKKEQCAICGKTLCSKYALKKHEDAVHFNIRPFGCDICQKRFIMKNDLKDHISAVHKKIKVTLCRLPLNESRGQSYETFKPYGGVK